MSGDGKRKRFAHVGTGSRSRFYRSAITGDYAPHAEYVGCCDINPGRLKLFQDTVEKEAGVRVSAFDAADFDRMIADGSPAEFVSSFAFPLPAEIVFRLLGFQFSPRLRPFSGQRMWRADMAASLICRYRIRRRFCRADRRP